MALIKNIIEIGFGAGLFVNALLFVPQIIKLLRVKDAKELSLLTFSGFCFIILFVILHGLINKDYFLVIGYSLSLIMCGLVTGLIIFYRLQKKRRVVKCTKARSHKFRSRKFRSRKL